MLHVCCKSYVPCSVACADLDYPYRFGLLRTIQLVELFGQGCVQTKSRSLVFSKTNDPTTLNMLAKSSTKQEIDHELSPNGFSAKHSVKFVAKTK